jgi:Flp pilus assembly protein TadG
MSNITLTTQELKELLTQAAAEGARLALKEENAKQEAKEWLTATEAMALIKCGTTKLHNLTAERRIITNGRNTGAKRYQRKSIINYISNGK